MQKVSLNLLHEGIRGQKTPHASALFRNRKRVIVGFRMIGKRIKTCHYPLRRPIRPGEKRKGQQHVFILFCRSIFPNVHVVHTLFLFVRALGQLPAGQTRPLPAACGNKKAPKSSTFTDTVSCKGVPGRRPGTCSVQKYIGAACGLCHNKKIPGGGSPPVRKDSSGWAAAFGAWNYFSIEEEFYLPPLCLFLLVSVPEACYY